MLGWFELGSRFHLAVEPLHGRGRLHRGGRERLHRHHSLHPPMLSLEYHAHPALTELVQNAVFPKDQPLGLALIDGGGLVAGQFVGAHEFAGERFRRPGASDPVGACPEKK